MRDGFIRKKVQKVVSKTGVQITDQKFLQSMPLVSITLVSNMDTSH